MPNLTDLTLQMYPDEEFFLTLKANASFIQVQTLKLYDVQCPTPVVHHHLAEALCFMPNLTDLTLEMDLNEEFFSTLKANASSIQVKTLNLNDVKCPTPASYHHLVEALCAMPNLTDLTLGKFCNEEFCSSLKANASSIQVKTLNLNDVKCPTPASYHHLVEALCAMPNLTDLTLGKFCNEEFCSSLKANASSIQVQTLKLYDAQCPTPAAHHHHLAEALCCMPNLTDLTLHMDLNEEFYFSLKANASSIQGCFPQIRKGNFRFNGVAQDDLNSFLHTLSCMPSLLDSDGSSELDGSANSGNSNDSDGSIDSDAPANSGNSNDSDGSSDSDAPANSGNSNASDGSSDSDAPANSGNSNDSDGSSDSDAPANSGNSNASDNSADCGNSNNLDCSADMANISVTTDVHSSRRALPPSDHPQHQPMGDVHSSRRALPPSYHPQHQPMGDVHSPRRTLPPSDHPQHQPMGDVHYPRWTLPPSYHPQHQPMGDVHSSRRALPPSDHPQHQPMDDVHSSRMTIPSSDHPQQHVGNTSDDVWQFSQTHREGSSSQNRPYKRKAPSTQSRVPQDDPEIPEKQSKYVV
ncbi:uncharacterized protein LOC105440295 [Strongylocentrotus purpuratus]|uniref:Uncharacterized protein n=1 Tax=Strongylocentrotus purpuratus TaxID=7668 RepID=A0A7M7PFV8_STRPU|nr:uncharacterized protein LOC105440295 [Strongylocentrotus purpuratus]